MKMNSIKILYQEFTTPEYFSRIDNEHPLDLFIGLDQKGRKAIKFRAKFEPRKIKGSIAIEISQYTNIDFNTLQFSLVNDEISGLFYYFCEDLIESSRNINQNDGYDYIINRFSQWKKLFIGSSKKLLDENEVMGLLGEIYFLKNYLFKDYGVETALLGWSGVDKTHKDFSYDKLWYEVKTTYSSNQSIKISSLEQLDSKNIGLLVVISLEKMSEVYVGLKLNDIILSVRKTLTNDNDKELFDSKLISASYEYNDFYDIYSYALKSVRFYCVNESFPRITKNSLPYSVIKVQYEILLQELSDFETKYGGEK